MKVLISGSTGLIGHSLAPYLASKGHQVIALVRTPEALPFQVRWNPPFAGPKPVSLEGIDAVVHLAGESIASGRWTASRKKSIRESRVTGSRLLVDALQAMKKPPRVFIGASAIGYYGDRGDDLLKESSPAGTGFLSELCKAWEAAAAPLTAGGTRLVHLRFGIILSAQGGALAKMLLPFKLGVGGTIGSGKQFMSWIALDDILGIIAFALEKEAVQGPVNAVAPSPASNAVFTKTLGKVLQRPTIFPMPAFAARLVFGEMADALLLSSARVDPAVLVKQGYHFQWQDLETALRHLLRK